MLPAKNYIDISDFVRITYKILMSFFGGHSVYCNNVLLCQAAKRDNLKKVPTRDTVRKIMTGQVHTLYIKVKVSV